MRRLLILFSFFFTYSPVFGQEADTIYLSHQKMADTIYSGLSQKATTGLLFNRLFIDKDSSFAVNCPNYNTINSTLIADADKMYQLIQELGLMDVNKTIVPVEKQIYDSVSLFVARHEFEKQLFIYPIGIFDYSYNILDETSGLTNGIISNENGLFTDIQPDDFSIVSTHKSALVAPLFDYFDSELMGIVFRKQDFTSNYRMLQDIVSIELNYKGIWHPINWDTLYGFFPEDTLTLFTSRITYRGGEILQNKFSIHSPEITAKSSIPSKPEFLFDLLEYLDFVDHDGGCGWNYWEPGCVNCGEIEDKDKNALQWCFIPSCQNGQTIGALPIKPYILVAGWRPPMFGQNFKKTWNTYNVDHGFMLSQLQLNGFDVILIRFNIHVKPYNHGMAESAGLLESFLIHLNEIWKTDKTHENILQGSSMGADIARLTFLRMEKKHLENNSYPHHHTRLFIAHDANFYGANIPFAYQCQIYSEYFNPTLAGAANPLGGILKHILFSTEEQKSFKELLMYHPVQSISINQWLQPNWNLSITPTMHARRQGYYDELTASDNGQHIFPMPIATRNIAISLGKISGLNSDGNNKYNVAGDYWHNYDFGVFKAKLGAAKYMPPGQYYNIYNRQVVGLLINPFAVAMKHNVMVTNMQEVDNCSASYLKGFGNIIDVCDFTYFPTAQVINGKNFFSHKSVLTALGINKNLWPSNGSHTLDMHSLNLMHNTWNLAVLQSNHFGYPHLGRPTDHFQVTPFDAIYVDTKEDPHIQLKQADQGDVAILNDFIKSEIEPWYLGLQNQNVGQYARSNYTYLVHRRAKISITAGYHVTPTTSDGDYVAEPNANILLRAGESITLKPGVHFKAGSVEHLKIEFYYCGN